MNGRGRRPPSPRPARHLGLRGGRRRVGELRLPPFDRPRDVQHGLASARVRRARRLLLEPLGVEAVVDLVADAPVRHRRQHRLCSSPSREEAEVSPPASCSWRRRASRAAPPPPRGGAARPHRRRPRSYGRRAAAPPPPPRRRPDARSEQTSPRAAALRRRRGRRGRHGRARRHLFEEVQRLWLVLRAPRREERRARRSVAPNLARRSRAPSPPSPSAAAMGAGSWGRARRTAWPRAS